jgi:hypothetical protein
MAGSEWRTDDHARPQGSSRFQEDLSMKIACMAADIANIATLIPHLPKLYIGEARFKFD